MGLLVAAFMLAGVTANPAMAQGMAKAAKAEKGKVTMTVLAENEKARAFEIRFKPGDEMNMSGMLTSSYRVIRALKGGTILQTFPDGKTAKQEWKTGEVRIQGPSEQQQYTGKNVGKSEIVLYSVLLK